MPHKDPEKAREYRRMYQEKHRGEAAERTRIWRLEHPGQNAATSRAWREQHPERAAEKERRYREANKEKVRAAHRAWRERNKDSQKEKRRAESFRTQLRVYGLTPESFEVLLAAQGGVCAICGTDHPQMRNATRLYVDHCHESSEIRGLLCFRCNSLLSHAGDNTETLRRAIAYLEAAGERHQGGGAVRGGERGL